jgi:hypothetical protein
MCLMPESEDTVPDHMCWTGSISGAKDVLRQAIANTDGNGDHWLDRSAVRTGAGRALVATFTVTGEGGQSDLELTVPPCRD